MCILKKVRTWEHGVVKRTREIPKLDCSSFCWNFLLVWYLWLDWILIRKLNRKLIEINRKSVKFCNYIYFKPHSSNSSNSQQEINHALLIRNINDTKKPSSRLIWIVSTAILSVISYAIHYSEQSQQLFHIQNNTTVSYSEPSTNVSYLELSTTVSYSEPSTTVISRVYWKEPI